MEQSGHPIRTKVIRRVRQISTLTACIAIVTLVCALVWAVWERTRDPLAAINPESLDATVVLDSAYRVGHRIYRNLVLCSDDLDTVRFTVSLPPDTLRPLPVIVIVGGLEIGRESLSFVRDHGNNAVVAYEYPYGPEYWYEGTSICEIPAIRSAVISVPGQLALLLRYVSSRRWADERRRVCFSYSFGAIFAPSFLRVAQAHGDTIPYTALIYGGANIERLLDNNLRIGSPFLRRLVAWGAATAIHVVEPQEHLPYLHSNFLVLTGLRDRLIPTASSKAFLKAVPEPKNIIMLDTEHMHPKALALIDTLVEISRTWLLDRKAME